MFVFRVAAVGGVFVFSVLLLCVAAVGGVFVFSVLVFRVTAILAVMVVFSFDFALVEMGGIVSDLRLDVLILGKADNSCLFKYDNSQCRCDDRENDGYNDLKCVFVCHFEYSLY
jgi:hypothetical protein